jgi:hypothetical protein
MINIDIEELFNSRNLLSMVYWMVQGDGNITLTPKQKSGYFQLTHSGDHEDYIEMKSFILSKITKTSYKKRFRESRGITEFGLWTACHPIFTSMHSRVYLNGRKVLTEHGIKMLSPICLAILYQDDGRYNPSKSTISINKPLYSEPELLMLAKYIVDVYGIIFRLQKSCRLKDGSQGYQLGLRYSDKEKFFDIIRPYVVPSMKYKIEKGGSFSY